MVPARRALSACEQGASDDFVGRYFLTGKGSLESFQIQMRQNFADSVAEIKASTDRPKK